MAAIGQRQPSLAHSGRRDGEGVPSGLLCGVDRGCVALLSYEVWSSMLTPVKEKARTMAGRFEVKENPAQSRGDLDTVLLVL